MADDTEPYGSVRNAEMSFGLRDHLIDAFLKILKITQLLLVFCVTYARSPSEG